MSSSCAACGGSGLSRRTCHRCGGSGDHVPDLGFNLDCPECDGRTYLEDDCSSCGGTGSREDGYQLSLQPPQHDGEAVHHGDRASTDGQRHSALPRPAGSYFPVQSRHTGEERLTDGAAITHAIVSNVPGRIELPDDPEARGYAIPMHSDHRMQEVTQNEHRIMAAARRFGVDADLVRAVIWMETTHGWYDYYWSTRETIRPMNIHAGWWSELGVTKDTMADPTTNIEAGVFLMSQLQARLVDPTPEKLFSLYNNIRADAVTGYGKTAAWYLEKRPWLWAPETLRDAYAFTAPSLMRDRAGLGLLLPPPTDAMTGRWPRRGLP